MSELAYAAGVSPDVIAEERIALLLAQTERAAKAQAGGQVSYIDTSHEATACRIVRLIVRLGWQRPEGPARTGEAA